MDIDITPNINQIKVCNAQVEFEIDKVLLMLPPVLLLSTSTTLDSQSFYYGSFVCLENTSHSIGPSL